MQKTNPTDRQPIPVSVPKMPSVKALSRHLKQIDANRYYSNFGPLVKCLERRISTTIGSEQNTVVTASSGTMALSLSIMAKDFPKNSPILVPSFTFIGTVASIKSAGHQPVFSDVDQHNWWLSPSIALSLIDDLKPKPVALVVVAPFGLMPNIIEWEEFVGKTGIEVFFDAAAADLHDISISSRIPIMVSLHATKMIGAAEGGFICCNDIEYIDKIRALSNFGISANGVNNLGTNAKLSEYHAAVALASFDEWEETRATLHLRCSRYVDNLSGCPGVSFLPGFGRSRVNILCVILGTPGLEIKLSKFGVNTRKWWRGGCHREPAFSKQVRKFPITEFLADRYLGLPMFKDISLDNIDFICEKILTQNSEFYP